MKLKMAEKSLFAYLLRSPWWVSILAACGIGLLGKIMFHGDYFSYALTLTLPFVVIAMIVAWRQKDVPSQSRVNDTVEAVIAMSWREFSALMEQAFRRDGFEVRRINGAADFLLTKEGRDSLVCCKRWKAASQGIEPLRALVAAQEAQEAREALYVSVIDLSDKARQFARDNRIALMLAPQLTRLLRLPKKSLPRTPIGAK